METTEGPVLTTLGGDSRAILLMHQQMKSSANELYWSGMYELASIALISIVLASGGGLIMILGSFICLDSTQILARIYYIEKTHSHLWGFDRSIVFGIGRFTFGIAWISQLVFHYFKYSVFTIPLGLGYLTSLLRYFSVPRRVGYIKLIKE